MILKSLGRSCLSQQFFEKKRLEIEEQMMIRLDEIGENYERSLGGCGVKNDQQDRAGTRWTERCTLVPMEMDYVSGSEPKQDDWEDVDDVRRRSARYNCGIRGHFARGCRRKGKGKSMKGAGKKAHLEDTREDLQENRRAGEPRTLLDVRSNRMSAACRWGVAARREIPTAQEVEDSLSLRKKAPAAQGCRSKYWANQGFDGEEREKHLPPGVPTQVLGTSRSSR